MIQVLKTEPKPSAKASFEAPWWLTEYTRKFVDHFYHKLTAMAYWWGLLLALTLTAAMSVAGASDMEPDAQEPPAADLKASAADNLPLQAAGELIVVLKPDAEQR